jgi:ribosomal-protein-alanine N-acetyltransferase
VIRTERLILRRWWDSDRAPFAALNADPEVMRYFKAPLTRAESDAWIDVIDDVIAATGRGLWAVERIEDGAFLGFTGLWPFRPDLPLHPHIEVGWRLARSAWGRGYATEAARASLVYGFQRLGLEQVFSITATDNRRSEAVMRRIGMQRRPELDFDHPDIAEGEPNRRQIVYRIGTAG